MFLTRPARRTKLVTRPPMRTNWGSGLAGGIAGYFIKTDLWEEVPLERPRVSLTPQLDGGFALGFSVRF